MPVLGIEFTQKYHGISEDGQSLLFSVSFGTYSKIISIPMEKAKAMLDATQVEQARKDEAARFNQFRRR